MRSPWPGTGHVNRNYGDLGERGYGRSGPPLSGQIHHNSYMEAENGRSLIRPSFPVFEGDWKTFEKNCLAEAHLAGINEAITVALKAYQKQWQWPFTTDPREEVIYSSDDEDEDDPGKKEPQELTRVATRSVTTKAQYTSRWERFPLAVAQAAQYQSPRLHRYLDRALDGPGSINLRSQFDTVPQDDEIGAWLALLRWNGRNKDPANERDKAFETYYDIKLMPREHPESL